MPYLSRSQLEALPFAALGREVYISDRASLYGVEYMHLADHIRIDDFCLLSAGPGGLHIGRYVHVSAYTLLVGRARIELGDFVNLSSRVAVYSSSDDFSGASLTNPLIPDTYKQLTHAPVHLQQHVLVGTNSTLLPGVTAQTGAVLGAHSLARGALESCWVYAGVPAQKLKPRRRDFLALAEQFLCQQD